MTHNLYICGTGNLATALGRELQAMSLPQGWTFAGWISRGESDSGLTPVFSESRAPIKPGDLVWLLTPDRFIHQTAARFEARGAVTVHSSGSVAITEDGHSCHAVWWPLQTFSRNREAVWSGVPVFVECADQELNALLVDIATQLKARPMQADSETRAYLHMCAVVANNFGNAMFSWAWTLIADKGLDPAVLAPIILQTGINAASADPLQVQTGPARRNDTQVIGKHEQMLQNDPKQAELYRRVSELIASLFKK